MDTSDYPPTMSVEQAGELLGISRRSAYRAVQAGQIPSIRLGRRLLVPTARLLRMLGLTETNGTTDPRSNGHSSDAADEPKDTDR